LSKETVTWMSERLEREITLVRWGEVGTPVLVFPTAGGDAEEIERFHLVTAVGAYLADGKAKLYSVDSLAGRAWFTEDNSSGPATNIQNRFDSTIYNEVLPAIRKDCGDDEIEIVTAGASLGAYNALAFLCRHPDVCKAAICMSGTYGLERFIDGPVTDDYYHVSPLHFVPDLDEDGDHLKQLRERFVLLTHGEGEAEDPNESWRVANVLGKRGIPNRVDSWGEDWRHDWVTWREMLPKYMGELLGAESTEDAAQDDAAAGDATSA